MPPRRKQKAKRRRDQLSATDWRKKHSDYYPPPECPASGKVPYRSVAAAERAMRHMQDALPEGADKPRRVYACEACGKFHLTKHLEWGS